MSNLSADQNQLPCAAVPKPSPHLLWVHTLWAPLFTKTWLSETVCLNALPFLVKTFTAIRLSVYQLPHDPESWVSCLNWEAVKSAENGAAWKFYGHGPASPENAIGQKPQNTSSSAHVDTGYWILKKYVPVLPVWGLENQNLPRSAGPHHCAFEALNQGISKAPMAATSPCAKLKKLTAFPDRNASAFSEVLSMSFECLGTFKPWRRIRSFPERKRPWSLNQFLLPVVRHCVLVVELWQRVRLCDLKVGQSGWYVFLFNCLWVRTNFTW